MKLCFGYEQGLPDPLPFFWERRHPRQQGVGPVWTPHSNNTWHEEKSCEITACVATLIQIWVLPCFFYQFPKLWILTHIHKHKYNSLMFRLHWFQIKLPLFSRQNAFYVNLGLTMFALDTVLIADHISFIQAFIADRNVHCKMRHKHCGHMSKWFFFCWLLHNFSPLILNFQGATFKWGQRGFTWVSWASTGSWAQCRSVLELTRATEKNIHGLEMGITIKAIVSL